VLRIGGLFLLLAGWGIVLCALMLLHGAALSAFVVAGCAVELLGMVLVVRTFLPQPARRRT
jgi:hypothetical protein